MDLTFACPTCAADITILDTHIGQPVTCEACGTEVDTHAETSFAAAQAAATALPVGGEKLSYGTLGTRAAQGNTYAGTGLIPCPLCRRDVSSRAVACPQCGHPITDTRAASGPDTGIASICSLLLTGLGQLVQGRRTAAVLMFGAEAICWAVFIFAQTGHPLIGMTECLVLAVLVRAFSVVDAAIWRAR